MFRKLIFTVVSMFIGMGMLFAEGLSDVMSTPWITDRFVLYFMYFIIFMLLVFVLLLYRISSHLAKYRSLQAGEDAEEIKPYRMWERFFQVKSVKTDKDVLLDHDYDGIKELDNPPPPWFMYLFYGTILFAVIYFVRFQITGAGPTQQEEYVAELEKAETARLASMETPEGGAAAVNITEDNVTLSTDENIIKKGKTVFVQFCQVCHGEGGKGISGPNLTDDYWVHGGDIKDLFKTIKYGVLDKGMASWDGTLSGEQIRDVSSYILNLEYISEADGGLAPAGELYVPQEADKTESNADTTAATSTEEVIEAGA